MSSRATGNDIVQVSGSNFPNVRPRIEMLADGGWVVIWTRDSDGSPFFDIFQQRYDPFGNPVGSIVQVNTQNLADQVTGDVAGLPDGGWLVTWHDFQTGNVFFQRYDVAGVPLGGETAINTTAGPQNYAPAVTVLADGGWLIVWEHNGASVRQQRYDSDGNAIGGEIVVNTSAFTSPTEAQTVALADGGWLVSWNAINDGTGSREIRMQRFDAAGNQVGTEATVNSTLFNDQILSRLCTLADGGWIVTWQGFDGARSQIYFQRYSSDGVPVGGEIIVNASTGGPGNFDADVAALADGGWAITYKFDFAVDGIYQQRFDQNGLAVGGPTRLDSGSASDLMTPQVVATPDGGWTTVWLESFGGPAVVLMRHFAADIYGSTGTDTLTGTHWDEALFGLSGNDVLDGGAGSDVMSGGYGDDTYHVDVATDEVRELFGQGTDTVISAASFSLLPTQVENLTLTGLANINGIGNGLVNVLLGNGGINTLNGNNGHDTLDGADGNDFLNGGGGNDILIGGAGNDRLSGGAGRDTANYATAAAAITVNLGFINAQDTVGAGIDTLLDTENLIGSNFDDTLTGNDLVNLIEGGGGNDTLSGGLGIDTVSYASAAAGVTVSLALAGPRNTVGAGIDTLSGFENLTGSAHNDTLTGNGGANILEGGLGDDVLNGAGSVDTASYASASSRVNVNLGIVGAQNTQGAGVDSLNSIENLIGTRFNDNLTGGSGANQIVGGDGDDTLQGAGGADRLIGGRGQDLLVGGTGADRFIFDDGDAAPSAADGILDFSQAETDRIFLSQIDANTALAGDQAFTFIGTAAFTNTAGELRQFTDGAFTVVAGDINGDGFADFLIYLNGSYTLFGSDFVL